MKHLAAGLIMLISSSAFALGWQNSAEVSQLFEEAGVEGTFVVYDVAAQRLIGHDHERAYKRFIPASTFKVPNTLIGLSVGAVSDVDEVLPYGGEPQPFPAWEQDMSLRDAISISNVAIYRELARRIGLERMQEGVAALGYGNAEIGSAVDEFWLVGPLRISAVEQVRFLARLAEGSLPSPKDAQKSVHEIIRLERRGDSTLYGKTGWENAPDPGVGWWVGWIERAGRVYPFALNIDVRQPSDADKRIKLGKASLRALGLL